MTWVAYWVGVATPLLLCGAFLGLLVLADDRRRRLASKPQPKPAPLSSRIVVERFSHTGTHSPVKPAHCLDPIDQLAFAYAFEQSVDEARRKYLFHDQRDPGDEG